MSQKSSIQDDLDLARAAAQGAPEAREQVARRLMTRVRNVVFSLVRNKSEAEDLAQMAMAEILVSLPSYNGGGALTHWADRIAVRRTMAFFRRRRREAQVIEMHHAGETEVNSQLADEDVMLRQRLTQHLHAIKEDRRTVLVLRLVNGLSLEEISSTTGAPLNTVKDRLRVGRNELRQAILNDSSLTQLVSRTDEEDAS